jgi:hypothetical protein
MYAIGGKLQLLIQSLWKSSEDGIIFCYASFSQHCSPESSKVSVPQYTLKRYWISECLNAIMPCFPLLSLGYGERGRKEAREENLVLA